MWCMLKDDKPEYLQQPVDPKHTLLHELMWKICFWRSEPNRTKFMMKLLSIQNLCFSEP